MAGSPRRLLISGVAVLVVGALICVVCLVLSDSRSADATVLPSSDGQAVGDDPPPTPRSQAADSRQGRVPRVNHASPSEQRETDIDAPNVEGTLRQLRESVPDFAGDSAFSSWSNGVRETSTAVFELTSLLESDARLDEPPFRAVWMFGRTDEQWVQSVAAAYRSGVVREIKRRETREMRSLSADERREIRVEWRKAIADLVREIGTARYARDDETQRRLADRRMLSQIPADSSDYKWLEICAQKLAPWGLATHFPELVELSDIRYLSGADMQRVDRISADIDRALVDAELLPSSPGCRDVLLPFARQFRDVVAPRRP